MPGILFSGVEDAFATGNSATFQGSGASIWEMIGLILILAAVVAGAYFVTRFVGGAMTRAQRSTGHLRVVDRLMLSKSNSVVVVELDGKYYLLGIGDDVRLLCEVQGDCFAQAPAGATQSFSSFLPMFKNRGASGGEPRDAMKRGGHPRSEELSSEELEEMNEQLRQMARRREGRDTDAQ